MKNRFSSTTLVLIFLVMSCLLCLSTLIIRSRYCTRPALIGESDLEGFTFVRQADILDALQKTTKAREAIQFYNDGTYRQLYYENGTLLSENDDKTWSLETTIPVPFFGETIIVLKDYKYYLDGLEQSTPATPFQLYAPIYSTDRSTWREVLYPIDGKAFFLPVTCNSDFILIGMGSFDKANLAHPDDSGLSAIDQSNVVFMMEK
jgi:hypothetical protein